MKKDELELLQKIKYDLETQPNEIYHNTAQRLNVIINKMSKMSYFQLHLALKNILTHNYRHLIKLEQANQLSVTETILLHDIDKLDEMIIDNNK